MSALGGDDDASMRTAAVKPAPDGLFADATLTRQPVGVDLRSVEKVATQLDKDVQQSERLLLWDALPRAPVPRQTAGRQRSVPAIST